MSITLQVKPDELKNKANSISESIKTVEKELKDIGNVILATKKYWVGDASDNHQKNYKAINEDIPTVLNRLKEHPKDLLEMAGIYEATEDENEKLAKMLPNNVIA